MSLIKLTPAAFFYLTASVHLHHGHAIWFNSSEIVGEHVLVDIPLLGRLDCEQSDWHEDRQEYVDREVILGLREIDLLLQLQGRLANREAMTGAVAGLEGWEVSGDYRRKTYSHRTTTGRLRFVLVSETYHHSDGGGEEIWLEVCAGDGKTVAAVVLRDGEWRMWYGSAGVRPLPTLPLRADHRPFGDELTMEQGLAAHNSTQRPDRFYHLSEMLFAEGEYLLPGQSLADVEHWGIGQAIKACLDGTAFDIADSYKQSLPKEEEDKATTSRISRRDDSDTE